MSTLELNSPEITKAEQEAAKNRIIAGLAVEAYNKGQIRPEDDGLLGALARIIKLVVE